VIPKPFFDATTRNYCIEYGFKRLTPVREPNEGERVLGAFFIPSFQRLPVWTAEQQVRFIESIWLHLPIGSYVTNRDDRHELNYPCSDWLLDGQQRWTAIIDYASDRFPVFDSLFSDLEIKYRRRFMNHPFPCSETRNLSGLQCRDVYERLAYGGTSHERK
jgi:uncharacterized protein with ParB-like and HNH nuclease domain